MGKTLSIIIGAAVLITGCALLFLWKNDVLIFVRGVLPAFFIAGGLIAFFAGISELKDTAKLKEEKKESNK